MPVAAALQFTQNAQVGGAGQAYVGIPGTPVTVANANNAGVISWTFSLLSVPLGSSFPLGVQQSGVTPTWTFTPDVPGSFLFILSVTDGSTTAIDTRSFLGADTRGWLYFSYLDSEQTLNYGNPPNALGWEPGLNFILKDIHNNAFGGGAGNYLPPSAPPNGTQNILAVDNAGHTSWQPVGGYEITGFSISGAGVSSIVEVGSTQAAINWSASFNFTPTSITVTCTGKAPQTPSPTGGSASGSFAGPFTSNVNNTTITVSITVVDPDGAPHSTSASMTYAVKIVWASVTSPIVGQALWVTMNGRNNILSTSLNATMGFTSGGGQQQTFATLAGLGTPTLKDDSGDFYPPVLLGSSMIIENGTTQTMNFYTVGVPGITFTWIMS
jgi:hypothetical protein